MKAFALVHQNAAAPPKPESKAVKELSPPSVNEMNDFYKSLNYCKIKPVALSLVNPYAEDFLLKSREYQLFLTFFIRNV